MTNENTLENGSGEAKKVYIALEDGTYVPLEDGSFIPKERFNDAVKTERNKASEREAQLLAENAALKATQTTRAAPEAEKRFSKSELNVAVKAFQITEEQSDEIWAKQIREDATREAEDRILGRLKMERSQERVSADINEYKRLAPEILDVNSDVRKKIAAEYGYLTGIGQPGNVATELAAIRAVLGSVDRLKLAKSSHSDDESHQETGGYQIGGSKSQAKTVVDGLSTREKDYYDGMIKKGMYKNWNEVEAELKFSSSDVRRKAAARA
jgi:hypothetical protein